MYSLYVLEIRKQELPAIGDPSDHCDKQLKGCGRGVMTKSELILKLSENNPHLYQRDVERIVSTIFDEISIALAPFPLKHVMLALVVIQGLVKQYKLLKNLFPFLSLGKN